MSTSIPEDEQERLLEACLEARLLRERQAGTRTSQPAQSSSGSSTTTTTILVDVQGMKIQIKDDPNEDDQVDDDFVMYSCAARKNKTKEERAEVYEKAIKAAHKKYDFLSVTVNNEDSLDDA
jgi:hypothetical protein